MEFDYDVASLVRTSADFEHHGPQIGLVTDSTMQGHGHRQGPLMEVLDALGKASAIAQGLRKPVTVGSPSLCGQRLYLLVDGPVVYGFLKVGTKRLFVVPPAACAQHRRGEVADPSEALAEINPVCALDFYVHESCQRHGHGRRIFEGMLQREGLHAAQLGYDRPSPKLLSFLAKHYGLVRYRQQNNNFVVYDEYFGFGTQAGVLEAGHRQELGGRGLSQGILPGAAPVSALGFAGGAGILPANGCPDAGPSAIAESLPLQPRMAPWEARQPRQQTPQQLLPPPQQAHAQIRQAPWDLGFRPLASAAGAVPATRAPYGVDGDGPEGQRRQTPSGGPPSRDSGGCFSRSASVPSSGRLPPRPPGAAAGGTSGLGVAAAGISSSHLSRWSKGACSSSASRHASPLSHAGRMLGQSPLF